MTCYHPLKGFQVGFHPSGKPKYLVTSYDVNWIQKTPSGKWLEHSTDVSLSNYLPSTDKVTDFITMKCGQCMGCRLDRSREWANRCMMELEYHDSAYFLTLTYNDKKIPRTEYWDYDTGEKYESLSLRKSDTQEFWKRLRYHYGKLRYYMCGEYGGETFRPHYHAIVFGLKLDDLKFYKRNFRGEMYYTSEKVNEIWENGYVVVSEVTWETCAYVARYVMKKLTGDMASYYKLHNIEPPFTTMSNKPGIARQWYDDHPEIYDYDYINLKTEKRGLKFRPPRYYDRLYDIEHPEEMAEIKEIRKRMAESATKLKLEKTSLSYLELLSAQEENHKQAFSKLQRHPKGGDL